MLPLDCTADILRPLAAAAAASAAWVPGVEFLGLGVTLPLGFGIWAYLRRHRAPVAKAPAYPAVAGPVVAFPCPGCAKRLKARANLAGKRVKCPQCGRAVPVPALRNGRAAPAPPGGAGRTAVFRADGKKDPAP
jgi:hypothetical protein